MPFDRNPLAAARLTEWIVALYEGYYGLIATDPKMKPKQSAKVARESVLTFLSG